MLDNSCESYPSLFQGGVSDEATLTAFVTVSLLESGMSPEVLLITCLIRSLQLAVEFVYSHCGSVEWKSSENYSTDRKQPTRVPHSHFVWYEIFISYPSEAP